MDETTLATFTLRDGDKVHAIEVIERNDAELPYQVMDSRFEYGGPMYKEAVMAMRYAMDLAGWLDAVVEYRTV